MGPLSGAKFESGEASHEMQSAYDKLLGPQKQALSAGALFFGAISPIVLTEQDQKDMVAYMKLLK